MFHLDYICRHKITIKLLNEIIVFFLLLYIIMDLVKYLVEFIGTFTFLFIILAVGQPIPIAVGLLGAIYFGGAISGGHFNPAVSVMMFMKNALSLDNLPFYIIAQVLGGLGALQFHNVVSTLTSS